jgi:hypothetical protein
MVPAQSSGCTSSKATVALIPVKRKVRGKAQRYQKEAPRESLHKVKVLPPGRSLGRKGTKTRGRTNCERMAQRCWEARYLQWNWMSNSGGTGSSQARTWMIAHQPRAAGKGKVRPDANRDGRKSQKGDRMGLSFTTTAD